MNETYYGTSAPSQAKTRPEQPMSVTEYYLYECLTVDSTRFTIHAESLPAAVEVARIRCQYMCAGGFTVYQV